MDISKIILLFLKLNIVNYKIYANEVINEVIIGCDTDVIIGCDTDVIRDTCFGM